MGIITWFRFSKGFGTTADVLKGMELGKPDHETLLTVPVCTWVWSCGGCTVWNGILGKPDQPRNPEMTRDLPQVATENRYSLQTERKDREIVD